MDSLALAVEALKLSPSELAAFFKSKTATEVLEIVYALETVTEAAGAYAAYLDERMGHGCGDQGHGEAVKAFNHTRKQTRAALGYSTTAPISF